jgi:hypothetical protein
LPGNLVSLVLGLLGAVLGGALGYFVFLWGLRQGFYIIALPATLLGAGCGLLSRHRSIARGVLCGIAGLALGLYAEWRAFPFKADESLGYFLTHLKDLRPFTLLLIGLGGLLAFYFGQGHLKGSGGGDQEPPKTP